MPQTDPRNVVELLNRQSILARFGALALRSGSLDEILTEACRLVGEALGTGLAKVMELQGDGATLLVRAGVGWKPGVVGRTTVLAEASSSEGLALATGEPVTSDDVATERRFTYSQYLRDNGVRAFSNVVIIGSDGRTPYGILEVHSRQPRVFDDHDVNFLQAYAGLLAAAVERLRTHEKMQGRLKDKDQRADIALADDVRRRIAVDVGEVGLWELEVETGRLIWDERMRRAFGISGDQDPSQSVKLSAIHPDDRAEFDRRVTEAMNGSAEFAMQYRTIGIDDGVLRWVFVQGRVLRDDGGQPVRFLGALRDVTDRVMADDHRAVLNQELAHRLKNTLAVVQSIATQTLRAAPDVETGRKVLIQRIHALSKAHDILLSGQRDAASLKDVVLGAVALHDHGGRVDVTGPEVALGSKASLTLALIVHELATNAGKYGALSVQDGRVVVEWSTGVDRGTRVPMLSFEWREVGGPPVVEPTHKSFGTRLIEMGLSGSSEGTSEIDYMPQGLVCRITALLTEVCMLNKATTS